MKIRLKTKYYKRVRYGEEPIKFRVSQPKGIGTDVHGVIKVDPILRKRGNADLRKALLKHEKDEIKEWAKGKSGHSKARVKEPKLTKNIGGVSGFWREIKRRGLA